MNIWQPRCVCGEPAAASLVYIWDNDREAGRSRDLCDYHYHRALQVWDRTHPVGLRVLVVSS